MAATEYKLTVQSTKWLTPTVFEITFEPDLPLTFKPGQFVSIVIPGAGPNGRDLRRAYSIASAPIVRPIELCIKLVEDGPGTNYLKGLKVGETFKGFAPYGDFVYKKNISKNVCFISTGTGIAPFRSMILSQEYKDFPPKSAYCWFGVRREDELLYENELAHDPKVHWLAAVSQPTEKWQGYRGRITDYIRSLGSDFPWLETEYYLCGNGSMIAEVKTFLTEKGVTKENIHQEVYYK